MNSVTRCEDRSPQGRAVVQEALETVVLMLSPVVPHAFGCFGAPSDRAGDLPGGPGFARALSVHRHAKRRTSSYTHSQRSAA